jgi:hypothetical protein
MAHPKHNEPVLSSLPIYSTSFFLNGGTGLLLHYVAGITYKQVHIRKEKYNQDLQLNKGDPRKESDRDRVHRPSLPPDRR